MKTARPTLETLPVCVECGEHLLPHETESCDDCLLAYHDRLVAWINSDADPEQSPVVQAPRSTLH